MNKAEPPFSRRTLLLALGGTTIAAGALVAAPFRSVIARSAGETVGTLPGGTPLLATASYEEWLACVGSQFIVGGVAMRLAGVQAFASAGVRPAYLRQRAFAAFFDPVGTQTMAGDLIYTATLAEYAPLEIFLSVGDSPQTPARMLAVFN